MPNFRARRRLIMRRGVSAVAAWTPVSLPNLIAWYKADAGVFSDAGVTPATNGQKVWQWNDQSGNGCHVLNSSTSQQPLFQSTSWTGSKPAVYFDASVTTTLKSAANVAIGSGSPFSCFAMCQMESGSSSNGRLIVYAASNPDFGGGGAIFISRNASTQAMQSYRSGNTAGAAITYTTDTRMGTVGDGVNSTAYINNVAGTPVSDTSTFTTNGAIALGGALNDSATIAGNSLWTGKVVEIVLTNAAMSSPNRALLDTYFTSRW